MAITLATTCKTTAFSDVRSGMDSTSTSGVKIELRADTTVVDYIVIPTAAFNPTNGELVYNRSLYPVLLFTVAPATYGVNNIRLLGAAPSTSAFSTVLFTYNLDPTTEVKDFPNGGTYSLPNLKFNTLEE